MDKTVHSYPLHPDCPDLRRLGPNRTEALLRAEAAAVQAEHAAERDRYLALNDVEEQQQDGRGVTRRTFVAGAAATATALATAQFVSTQASFAATRTGTLVHVFLYGGLDGLSLIAPGDDPYLKQVRPDLLIEGASKGLDRGFMMTKAFEPLVPFLGKGQLGFVPAVSDPRLSRSHFQAQDACNLGGLPSETGGRGWLDSLVDQLGAGTAFRSVGIGSTLPRSLVGTNGAISMDSVGELRLQGDQRFTDATEKAIKGLFTDINHPIGDAVIEGLGALTLAKKLAATNYKPAAGATYEGGVGNAFRELARLIKGGANVRVATVGTGGYDTHENQGPREGGQLFGRLNEVASAMAAFFTDLGDLSKDVTVLVSSEFGRRVASNKGGTDHGHGGVVTILAGQKLAGSLLGKWEPLSKDTLDSGDVAECNNMFSVYGAVAQGRFGLSPAQAAKVVYPRDPKKYVPIKIYG